MASRKTSSIACTREGQRRIGAVPDEPDLHQSKRRDIVSGARHSSGDLVGEGSCREGDAYRHRTMDGAVGSIDRPDTAAAKDLNEPYFLGKPLKIAIFIARHYDRKFPDTANMTVGHQLRFFEAPLGLDSA